MIVGRIGLTPIEEKMIENRKGGLDIQMPLEALVRRVDHIVLSPVKRGRGRSIKTLEEIIKRFHVEYP